MFWFNALMLDTLPAEYSDICFYIVARNMFGWTYINRVSQVH
jgi:hypothetical protein